MTAILPAQGTFTSPTLTNGAAKQAQDDMLAYLAGLPSSLVYAPAGGGAVNRTVQAKLREIVSPEDFGAAGDGVTNDTTALVNFFAALNAGAVGRGNPTKVYLVDPNSLAITADNVEIDIGWLRPRINTAGYMVRIGAIGTNTRVVRLSGHLRLGAPTLGAIAYPAVSGLRLENLTSAILSVDAQGLGAGIDASPSDVVGSGFVAYNTFLLGRIYNNQIGIKFNPTGAGACVNENKFIGGRIGMDTGGWTADCWAIWIGGGASGCNNNHFYSPSLEVIDHLWYCASGPANRIISCRLENSGNGGHEYVNISGDSNSFEAAYSIEMASQGYAKNLGAPASWGGVSSPALLTFAGDLTAYLWPGTVIECAVTDDVTAANKMTNVVLSSSHAAGTTTVYLALPILASAPVQCRVPYVVNTGTGNSIAFGRTSVPGGSYMAMAALAKGFHHHHGAAIFQGFSSGGRVYPGATFHASYSQGDPAWAVMGYGGRTAWMSGSGNLTCQYVYPAGLNIGTGGAYVLPICARYTGTFAQQVRVEMAASSGVTTAVYTGTDCSAASFTQNGVLYLGKHTSSSRSLNATGTLNASGADYAEYMAKRPDCGVIAKGDVAGIDADGLLTDRYDLALSYRVKSTAPNLVGNDTWMDGLEPPPEPLRAEEEAAEDYAERLGQWRQSAPDWLAFVDERERRRATVDRMAWSGQVPVNITGNVVPGQYVVARRRDDGGIMAVCAPWSVARDEEHVIGKVYRVMDTGQAWVAVG